MKQFNWTRIADPKTLNTVWEKLSDDHVRVNQKELEMFFAAAAPAPKKEATGGDSGDHGAGGAPGAGGEKKPAAKKNISMLDPRRGQNVSIMLSKFKMPLPDIRKAIETLNESVLTPDNLVVLKQYIPTEEELAAINEVDDKESLNIADKYFLELAKIPDLGNRLECLSVRSTFAGKIGAVGTSIDVIKKGCDEVKNSKTFAKYLEIVLKVGNILNGGTTRGGAYGFKLDTLIKIADVRSTNKETPTLLHYIAAKAETDFPELKKMHEEFPGIVAASKESLSQVASDLGALEKGVRLIEGQIRKAEGGSVGGGEDGEKEKETEKPVISPRAGAGARGLSPNDPFIIAMKQFHEKASKACTNLSNKLKALETLFKELLTQFGEEPSSTVEAFLGTISRAVSLFHNAMEDNKKRIVAAQNAALAEERRERLKKNVAAAAAKNPTAGEGGAAGGDGDRNVMDNLIGQLHTGDAFVGRTGLRKGQPARPGGGPVAAGKEDGGQVANEALALFAKMKSKREGV